MVKKAAFLIIAMVLAVLAACGGGSSGAQQTPATLVLPADYAVLSNPLAANDQTAVEAGQQIYQRDCSTCHGADGRGNGPAAASLDPRPANLVDPRMNLSDVYLFWRISEGGAVLPIGSQMPAWKGSLSQDQIWQVVAYLRSLVVSS